MVKYCDGTSFTSNREDPVVINGTRLHFRGRAILVAVFDTLVRKFGLQDASALVVTGGSAGGIAVFTNIDFIARELLPSYSLSLSVVGSPDAGFFLDAPDATGQHVWWKRWRAADALWGSTAAGNTNKDCLAHYPPTEAWKCLMAPYLAPFIHTPLFVSNSDIDMWSVEYILGVKCLGWGRPWPPVNCTSADVAAIQRWRDEFHAELPQLRRRGNGYFVDTCIVHEQTLYDCNATVVPNCAVWGKYKASPSKLTLQRAFHDWYVDVQRTEHFVVDASTFPGGNPSCESLSLPASIDVAI